MSNEKEKLKCVFCSAVKTDKLILFSEETMSKCRKILRLRKLHDLKYKDIILPDEMFDAAYHSSCYKTFTALKRKFFSTDVQKKLPSQPSTSSSGIQQPSTSSDNLIISDKVVHDSLVEDVSVTETEEAGKEIEAEAEQPLEEGTSEVLVEASTVQTYDPAVSTNSNFWGVFCNKKKKQKRSKNEPLRISEKEFEKSILSKLKLDTEIYNETLVKIQSIPSCQIYYHDVCQQNFRNQKRSLVKCPVRTSWHIHREIHATVYTEICHLLRKM